MKIEIKNCETIHLIGFQMAMTYANNQTGKLWQSFMPRRNEIQNALNNDLISMQIYDESFNFEIFDANKTFIKWAAKPVSDIKTIPEGMQSFLLESGLYAIFHYQGRNTDTQIFNWIFSEWIPNSIYQLDHRPHFEVLGEKYKNNDPLSEEEIWIPIKLK